jgi:hypothetical protein
MPIVKLTDPFCRTVKPESGRQIDFFDKIMTGLCFRVSPGGTRTFQLVYTRPENNKRARITLGRYPDQSLAEARAQHHEKKRIAETKPTRDRPAASEECHGRHRRDPSRRPAQARRHAMH